MIEMMAFQSRKYSVSHWETVNSYISILKYADNNKKINNLNKLSPDDFERIRKGETTIEECIVSRYSFQKPSQIIRNFIELCNIDVNSVFEKSYGNVNLKSSIENVVTLRNRIVHEGYIKIDLTYDDVRVIIDEIEEAVDRFYRLFAESYGFKVNDDFDKDYADSVDVQ